MIKRNSIVYNKGDAERGGFAPYGRVSRILSDGRIETIDCGRYIRVQDASDLVICSDYAGFTMTKSGRTIFVRMPSLRKLKQMAARYDKTVWKRFRKDVELCDQTRLVKGA